MKSLKDLKIGISEEDPKKLPGYEPRYPDLEGIHQQCHPNFKYKKSNGK